MTTENGNQPKYTSEHLGELVSQLEIDQVRFVVARQELSTDKAAAQAIGIKPDTVKKWKHKGIPIDAAVRAMAMDGIVVAAEVRRRNLAKAMLVKVGGLDSGSEKTRQSVATEIIEWEMGKATQKREISGPDGKPVAVSVDYSTLSDDDLRETIADKCESGAGE